VCVASLLLLHGAYAEEPALSSLQQTYETEVQKIRDRHAAGQEGLLETYKRSLETAKSFEVPIEIEYRVMTDSTNIRLVYACKQLIFNWEVKPRELRLDGGPANRQHRPGKGYVPPNTFLTIRQVVLDDRMQVYVDGTLRTSWQADFSGWRSPIGVFSCHGSTVTVESIRTRPPPEQ